MSFWVVRYDIKSLKKGATYTDMGVESPFFMRPNYNFYECAEAKMNDLNKSAQGTETIEIELANGKHYKGPRYVYRIAEDDKPAEENPDDTEYASRIRSANTGVHSERKDEHSPESRSGLGQRPGGSDEGEQPSDTRGGASLEEAEGYRQADSGTDADEESDGTATSDEEWDWFPETDDDPANPFPADTKHGTVIECT